MPTVTKGTNSYLAEAEAASYFAARLHASAWTGASEVDQQKALLMATTMLDRRIHWKGTKADRDQALEWPRYGVTSVSNEEVPITIQEAQAELALILIGMDLLKLPDTAGLKSLAVDTIRLSMAPADRHQAIPDNVFALVANLGTRAGGLGSIKAVL